MCLIPRSSTQRVVSLPALIKLSLHLSSRSMLCHTSFLLWQFWFSLVSSFSDMCWLATKNATDSMLSRRAQSYRSCKRLSQVAPWLGLSTWLILSRPRISNLSITTHLSTKCVSAAGSGTALEWTWRAPSSLEVPVHSVFSTEETLTPFFLHSCLNMYWLSSNIVCGLSTAMVMLSNWWFLFNDSSIYKMCHKRRQAVRLKFKKIGLVTVASNSKSSR